LKAKQRSKRKLVWTYSPVCQLSAPTVKGQSLRTSNASKK